MGRECVARIGSPASVFKHVTPTGQQSHSPVIEDVQTRECLRPRTVAHPWAGETDSRVEPTAQSKSVFRTLASILVPVNHVNPVAIADSGGISCDPVDERLA